MQLSSLSVADDVAKQLDTLPGFWSKDWRKRTALYRRAWTVGLLPSLADLDELLAYSLLRYPFVSMYAAGVTVPTSAFTSPREAGDGVHIGYFDYTRAMDLFAAGTAIELGAMNQWYRPAGLITAALGDLFEAQVDAQVFITPPYVQGVLVHRDRSDALVVHIAGSKRWKLYSRPEDARWRGGFAEDPGELIDEVVLDSGDVLYLAAGTAHEVQSTDAGPSAHITFGIRHVDGFAIVDQIATRMRVGLRAAGMRPASELSGAEGKVARIAADALTGSPTDFVTAAKRTLNDRNYRPRVGRLTEGGRE